MDDNKDIGNYCVYMHISPSDKRYIGITKHGDNPNLRWKNGNGYKKNSFLYSAIKKYGWDNFKHEIVENLLSEDEAKEKEIYYIKLYKSNDREYGYNFSAGGESRFGVNVSEEQKARLREFFTGKKVSYSENGSKKKIEMMTGKNNPLAKEVICDGVIYETITSFIKQHDIKGNVKGWLSGKTSMPEEWYIRGLRFVNEDYGLVNVRNYKTSHHDAKSVICEGIIYESIKLCADAYGINSSTMSSWLRGKRRMPQKWIDRCLTYFDKEEVYENQ